jgi:hypothetical protein
VRFLIALLLFLSRVPAPPQQSGSISGRIVRYGNMQAVPHARLVLAKVGGNLEDYRSGFSDSEGHFVLQNLSPGTYRLYVQHGGYPQTEYEVRISLADGQALNDIVVKMTPFGVITGRVTDRNLNPVRHVWVGAMRAGYFNGHRSLSSVNYAETDDRGEYRIFDLPPGFYFVSAVSVDAPRIEGETYVVSAIPSIANRNQGQIRKPVEAVLKAGEFDSRALDTTVSVPVFYPGTTDPAAATSLDLGPGATRTGIDLIIASAPAVHVRGTVINGVTGQPAQNVAINLIPHGRQDSIGSTATLGSFDIAGVVAGSYDLTAQTTRPPELYYASIPVEVGSRDVQNITMTVKPGIAVTAHFSMENGAALADVPGVTRFFVQLNGATGGGYSVPMQPNGVVPISNVRNGDFTFRIFPPTVSPSTYVKSARFAGMDALQSGIHIDAASKETDIDVVLATDSGNIDATVIDDQQQPIRGAMIALVPDAAHRNRSDLYRTATADAVGRARLQGIPPGDYKLFAARDSEPAWWQDPDFLRLVESRGELVHVPEAGNQTVTLKPIPNRY